ncbi:LuxR C-terminal-related transcriptional regulator [Amnibacterium sp. CER49]|uniref:LuxR family transcriptional regulator n=1 Tax=Amnibacterium sp. CER49 TaxID=3039161 RepID=UPI0024481882|nr:LuxR family transcriptional regulator [Amnibacterium sp. CER49]MDH2443041.1 LuxR C-terminal-related transcriptional regulator [Amnibacterium sp. CER49]
MPQDAASPARTRSAAKPAGAASPSPRTSPFRLEPRPFAKLVEELLGAPVESGAALVLLDRTGGSPAALRELVETSPETFRVVDGLVRLAAAPPLPPSLSADLRARFAALPEPQQEAVRLVAAAGRVPAAVASRVAVDEPVPDWLVTDPAGTVRPAGGGIAEVALDGVPRDERQRLLHLLLRVAAGLDRLRTDAERIAVTGWRLELGEPLPVDEAMLVANLPAAPPVLRERLLLSAIDTGGGTAARLALAEHRARRGDLDTASRLVEETGGTDPSGPAAAVGLQATLVGLARRRPAAALTTLDLALRTRPRDPELLAARIPLLLLQRRLQDALLLSATLAGRRSGTAGVRAGIAEVAARMLRGDETRARAAAEALRPLAAALPGGDAALLDWAEAAIPLLVTLDLRAATARAERAYDRALLAGRPEVRAPFAHLLARCRLLAGDPGRAVHLLREAESAPGLWRDAALPLLLATLVEALVLAGRGDEAEEVFERLLPLERPPAFAGAVDLAEAALAAGRGEHRDAAALATRVARRASADGAASEAFSALHAALRYGDGDAARRILELGAVPRGPGRDVQRDHARAILDGDPRELERVARRYWDQGLGLFATELAATAVERHGAFDIRAAHAAAARARIWRDALPTLAAPVVAAAPPALTLTPRERETARLAATGLTDRDIAERLGISVRTAQTHLGRAYGKLGVHSRKELAPLLPRVERAS